MLKGKVALVTGAAQGIGQQIAIQFAQEGAKVAIIDIKKMKATEKAFSKIEGAELLCFDADVADENAVKGIVDQIVEKWGQIDILVNNAGIYPLEHFTKISMATVRRVFETNVIGLFACSQIVVNQFIEKSIEGIIINIASATGLQPNQYHVHYAASKAAVISITKGIATELLPQKIRVNTILPGAIMSKGVSNPGLFTDSKEVPEGFGEFQKKINYSPLSSSPSGMGSTEDIANAAVFLASDKAKFITGDVMLVDGGRLLL